MMHPPANGPYIDRGEPLPRSYAENCIVAMVQDPHHIYAYWDVELGIVESGEALVVRVHCLSEASSHDIEPPAYTDNWYLNVAANRTYQLELFKRTQDGSMISFASSDEVSTPVAHAGESGPEVTAEMVSAQRHPMARKAAPAGAAIVQTGMPSSPPTIPVPAPAETVLAPDYASGRGG